MKFLKLSVLAGVVCLPIFYGCEVPFPDERDPFFREYSAYIIATPNTTLIGASELDPGKSEQRNDDVYTFTLPLEQVNIMFSGTSIGDIVVGKKYPAIFRGTDRWICVPGSPSKKEPIFVEKGGIPRGEVKIECPDGGVDTSSISSNWQSATMERGDLIAANSLNVSLDSQGVLQFYKELPALGDCSIRVEMAKRIIWIEDGNCLNSDISFVTKIKIDESSSQGSKQQLGEFFRSDFEYFSFIIGDTTIP